MVKYLFFTCRT